MVTTWAFTRYISLICSVISRGICIFSCSFVTMVWFQGTPISLGIHSWLHNKILTFQSNPVYFTVYQTFHRRGKKCLIFSGKGRSRHPTRWPHDEMHAARSATISCKKITVYLLQNCTSVSSVTVLICLKSFEKSHKLSLNPRKYEHLASWNLTAEYWGKTIFFDESTLQQLVSKRNISWSAGRGLGEKYTIQAMKHPPSKIIWWYHVLNWNEITVVFTYIRWQMTVLG